MAPVKPATRTSDRRSAGFAVGSALDHESARAAAGCHYGFKRVIGIEFATELHGIAAGKTGAIHETADPARAGVGSR
jgi:hypothetical protein